MNRRLKSPALFGITVTLLTLLQPLANAQTDASQSPVAGAGFDAQPPSSSPVAPPPTATQTGTPLPGQAPTPTIHVFSRETILDVLVTDDKGNPVRGLTRNDFTVLEDGKPLPLRSFSENSASEPASPPTLPPNIYTNANILPANGPVQIFLIERPVIAPPAPPPALMLCVPRGLIAYLHTMPHGTQVAIFTFSSITALQMVQGFTSDGNKAADAASRIRPDVGIGYKGPASTIQEIAGMEQIAAYVAGIHGRKNLMWLFRGAPPMVTRDGGYQWTEEMPSSPTDATGHPKMDETNGHDMTIVHRLMDVYETFSREQIAVYPVDPNGVHGLGIETMKIQEIADETGGTYDNTNDKKAEIAGIVDRSSDWYTLSFIPSRLIQDSRFHSIKIQVNHPGVNLTYRVGYDDDQPRPPDRMLKADLMQGPMRLGALPATQLLFTLALTPAPAGTSDSRVQVNDKHHVGSSKDRLYNAFFRFDPTQIAFTETPDGKRTANLEFDLGLFDNFSQLGPVRSQVITLSVNASGYNDFMRKPFEFTLPIPIPAGQQTLRAGLFDTVSGKAGTLEVPLTIPKR